MFAGMTSSSRATFPNTEMRRRDRRWDSEVRPVRCSTSSFRTRSYHRIPSSCLRHFWWKASRVLADVRLWMLSTRSDNKSDSLQSHERSKPTSGPVSTWMGDRLRLGILSRYLSIELGQLSLASLRGRLIEYQLRLG